MRRMSRWLILPLVLLLALPVLAQEATAPPMPPWWIEEINGPWPPPWWNAAPPEAATPTPEPEATATPLPYAWCGYLLLEGVVIDADALAMLATLFPAAADEAPLPALMQWRARPDGNGGILEGCHLLPVERWRVVSLLQQGTGMDYAQMDASLALTVFPNVDAVRGFLEQNAAEWEAPIETPTAVPLP
jgi:hypothetical protein